MKLTLCEKLLLVVLRLPMFNRLRGYLFNGIDVNIEGVDALLKEHDAENTQSLIQERQLLLVLWNQLHKCL